MKDCSSMDVDTHICMHLKAVSFRVQNSCKTCVAKADLELLILSVRSQMGTSGWGPYLTLPYIIQPFWLPQSFYPFGVLLY